MTKRHLLAALLSTALLGACASIGGLYGETASPRIVKVDGTFTVAPYILYFKTKGEVEVVWRVPPGSGLKFAEEDSKTPPQLKGIFIDGEFKTLAQKSDRRPNTDAKPSAGSAVIDNGQTEIVGCKRRSDLEYVCLNRHTRPGLFKYTIRLTDGTNDYVLDPFFDNW